MTTFSSFVDIVCNLGRTAPYPVGTGSPVFIHGRNVGKVTDFEAIDGNMIAHITITDNRAIHDIETGVVNGCRTSGKSVELY